MWPTSVPVSLFGFIAKTAEVALDHAQARTEPDRQLMSRFH
jgi:hypothetical protein